MATRPYAEESRGRSWFHLLTTLAVLIVAVAGAILAPWWPLKLLASVIEALTMVRLFILLHDLHHAAIFRDAPVAKGILKLYGLVLLTPTRIWTETHNYHHAHTAKTEGSQRGTFKLLTTKQWLAATPKERFRYRVERNPLIIVFGYVTCFLLGFGVVPTLTNPRRYWDSVVGLILHVAAATALLVFGGFSAFFFAFLLPFLLSGVMGTYLFYVQHNFEGAQVAPSDEWNHTKASLEGSSYLKTGPVMRWFTGNIGFHHVHHLNPRIPFYRLPVAMREIPEFQHPIVTTLDPRTIVSSLHLKLWDPDLGRMVGFGAVKKA